MGTWPGKALDPAVSSEDVVEIQAVVATVPATGDPTGLPLVTVEPDAFAGLDVKDFVHGGFLSEVHAGGGAVVGAGNVTNFVTEGLGVLQVGGEVGRSVEVANDSVRGELDNDRVCVGHALNITKRRGLVKC